MKKIFGKLLLIIFLVVFIFVVYYILFGDKRGDALWGYINTKGETVIKPQFYKAYNFKNGLAVVEKYGSGDGYINKSGEFVIPATNNNAYTFSEGLGLIERIENNKLIFVFIDSTGKSVLKFDKYTDIKPFSEGLAAVATESHFNTGTTNGSNPTTFGYINKRGVEIIKPNKIFYYANKFSDSVAVVASADENQYYFLINHKGKVITEFFSQSHSNSSNNRIRINNHINGYINTKGDTVIPFKYSYASNFSEGFAPVAGDGYGFIDTKGEIVLGMYQDVGTVSEGMAAIKQNGLWGYIDTFNVTVIEHKYKQAKEFHEGLAAVQVYTDDGSFFGKTSWGFINKKGKMVIPPIFVNEPMPFSEGLAAINNDTSTDSKGLMFLIIPLIIFLGFIASIIFVIVYFVKKNKNSNKLAKQPNWKYYKSLNTLNQNSPFIKYMENSLFNILSSEEKKVTDIVNANYKDMEFWFSFYKSYSTKGTRSMRTSTTQNIFVIPATEINQEFILFYKTKLMKMFFVEKLSKFLNKPLLTPQKRGLEWIMVTDISEFDKLNLDSRKIEQLQLAMEGAHSILFYKGFFIYAVEWPTTLSLSKIKEFLPKVYETRNILTK